jgi:hypothetical protein
MGADLVVIASSEPTPYKLIVQPGKKVVRPSPILLIK